MDRRIEVEHLAEADRHIEEAKTNIARVEALVAAAIERGEEAVEGQAALAAMKVTLDTFNAQRAGYFRRSQT